MFDRNYQIADVYFPHVGMENHALGHQFRFGVFADNKFSWAADWSKTLQYLDDTLVTDISLENQHLGLRLHCNDCVDFVSPIYLKKVRVTNLSANEREIRLFFHHDFHIRGTSIGDTAYFDPIKTKAMIHYKTDRYFLMNCQNESGEGIFQYACGVKEVGSALGTWKDAEDGFLSGNPIAQGSVDSVISTRLTLPANGDSTFYYWMVAGKSYDDVQRRDAFIKSRTPSILIKRTTDFWKLWVSQDNIDKVDLDGLIWKLYRRSLLTIKSQTDLDGAVIAGNDSDIMQFNKDTYSYMWPRDGAFVTMAMDDSGYHVFSRHFFEFCAATILSQGWYFHKYQPDRSPGSSWHPWVVANKPQLPIQEDETALVVMSLWNHFVHYKDVDLIKPFYRPVVKNAGQFMLEYRDKTTGLPLESYDPWEERRQVLTYTCSSVYAGLVSAANFAGAFGEVELEQDFGRAAEEIKNAIIKNMYDTTLGRFLRGIELENGEVTSRDATMDSSLAGVFLFGVLPPSDPMVVNTMRQVESRLTVKTSVGGVARYEHDRYQALGDYGESVPGNPWFVTSLWLADWYIGYAKSRSDLTRAKDILNWAVSHTLPSGIMAEQLNPYTGEPLSVSPLTWSHGAFVDTVNRYVRKYNSLSQ